MKKNDATRRVSRNDYIAGVAVANAPVWAMVAVRDILFPQESTVSLWLIALGVAGLGGQLAGYLVARRTGQNYRNAGLTIGLLAYVAYAALSMVVRYRAVYYEDLAVVFGFALGSSLGAQFWTMSHGVSG